MMTSKNPLVSVAMTSVLLFACVGIGCSADHAEDRTLPDPFRKLLPLHTRLGKPQPNDWLARYKEPGQTFGQYVRCRPIRATEHRRTIYLQPLGPFNPTQRKILDLTAEFTGIYFDLPVKIREDLSLDVIPKEARRKNPVFGMDQLLAPYILDSVLKPRLPDDAVALLAFTASDLWPGEGWNYVFGEASLAERVGVWSIYRNGDPDQGDDAFRVCLRRTLQTATHETGHMFSMQHCTFFECNMCGSNHLAESDRRPLVLCPICLAKLCHATGADPVKRFEKLLAFHKQHGLKTEEDFCRKSLEALRQ
jgi:archaemetzincin